MIKKLLCLFGYHKWAKWNKTGFTTYNEQVHWSASCLVCDNYQSMWFWKSNIPIENKRLMYRIEPR